MSDNIKFQKRISARRASATVQFALTFPLLLLFVFGSLEFARANLIRNMCENAAMEGARAGSLPGATAQNCIDAAQTLLDMVGVQNSTITVDPPVIDSQTENITVTVNIPLDDNGLTMSQFVLGAEMQQTVSLPREYDRVPTGGS